MASLRSFSTTTYASRTNTTVTAPTGIADGDILTLAFCIGISSSTPPSITLPTGFSLKSGYPVQVNSAGFYVHFWIAEKTAASESGNYTVTHSANSSQGLIICAQSASASNLTTNSGTGTTSTATGLTAGANSLIAFLAHNWDLYGGASPPTGTTPTFTERHDSASSVMYLATGEFAAGGSTGNKSHGNLNSGTNPWRAFLIEWPNAAGTTHTTTGALSAQDSSVAGSATHLTLHTTTGALASQAATLAGSATHLTLHTTTGALAADAAIVSGVAAHQHTITGALVSQDATVAGSAAHLTLHTTTGALSSQDATVAGSATRSDAAGSHATDGALAAQDATVAGSATHLTLHTTTGALAADAATIAGSATHLTLHTTTGALVSQDSEISGIAAGPTLFTQAELDYLLQYMATNLGSPIKYWDGSQWQVKNVLYWNGSAWV